jgi:hypothetical protein
MDGTMWIIVSVVGLFLYFVPAGIAGQRGMASATGVFVANLFLGWTFLGWVLCLIWAFTGKSKAQQALEANEQTARMVEAYQATQGAPSP